MSVKKQCVCEGAEGERKLVRYISDNKWAAFIVIRKNQS